MSQRRLRMFADTDTGTGMVHAPYKGMAPALTGLTGGEVQVG